MDHNKILDNYRFLHFCLYIDKLYLRNNTLRWKQIDEFEFREFPPQNL